MADDDERRVGGAKGRAPEPEAPAAITVADLGPDAPPQMVELARQNKVLSNQLESKDRELASLREIAEMKSDLGAGDARDVKITDLAKRNREAGAQLAKEKAAVAQLKKELDELKKGPSSSAALPPGAKFRAGAAGGGGAADGGAAPDDAESLRRELKAARDRGSASLERVGRLEAQLKATMQERDKLLVALKSEIGEDLSLEQLMKDITAGEGSWVGRGQEVAKLKEKVRELQKAQGLAQDTRIEKANLDRIQNLREKKAQEGERALQELDRARAEMEKLKLKADSQSGRIRVLSNEIKDLRSKISTVLDKTANDDQLINALRSQLEQARKRLGDQGKAADMDRFLAEELDALRVRCAAQEQQIDRQQAIILQLRGQAAAGAPSGTQRLPSHMAQGPGSRPGSTADAGIPSIDGRPSSVRTLPPLDGQGEEGPPAAAHVAPPAGPGSRQASQAQLQPPASAAAAPQRVQVPSRQASKAGVGPAPWEAPAGGEEVSAAGG